MEEENVTYNAEQINQLLQCSVCLDRFNDPRILPCQHTFCRSPCLENLVDRRMGMIKCPQCREHHFLPREGAAGFAINRTVVGFLDLNASTVPRNCESQSDPNKCSICSKTAETQDCLHCSKRACATCKSSHFKQLKKDIERLVGQTRKSLRKVSDFIGSCEQKTNQVEQMYKVVKRDISSTIEKLIKEVQDKELVLLSEAETLQQLELRNLRLARENLEVDFASISSHCESSEGVIKDRFQETPEIELVALKKQCLESLEQVRGIEESSIPELKQPRFTYDPIPIRNGVASFGRVSVGSPDQGRPRSQRSNGLRESSNDRFAAFEVARGELNGSRNQPAYPEDPRLAYIQEHPLEVTLPLTRTSRSTPRMTPRNVVQAVEDTATRLNAMLHTRRQYDARLEDILSQTQPAQSALDIARRTDFRRRRRGWSQQSREPEEARAAAGRAAINRHRNTVPRNAPNMSESEEHQSLGSSSQDPSSRYNGLPSDQESRADQSQRQQQSVTPEADATESGRPASQESSHHTEADESESITSPQGRPTRESTFVLQNPSGRRAPRDLTRRPVAFEINLNASASDEETTISYQHSQGAVVMESPRNHYRRKGVVRYSLGSRGSDSGCFTWPRGVAVVPCNDSFVVADSSNHRCQLFDLNGHWVLSFGSYGQAEAEFDCLAGVAADCNNRIIIADRYNHRIQIFNRYGEFLQSFGEEGHDAGQLSYPWGVACDCNNRIYVCDKENHRVQVFDANGQLVTQFGSLGSGQGQLENPHYLAVSRDRVVVSDSSNHRLQLFDTQGTFLRSVGEEGAQPGQFKHPRGVVVDDMGYVLVGDSGNNRVQVLRPDFSYYCHWGEWGSNEGQFKGIEGVAVNSQGHVIVSDRENHRVQVF